MNLKVYKYVYDTGLRFRVPGRSSCLRMVEPLKIPYSHYSIVTSNTPTVKQDNFNHEMWKIVTF